MKSNFAACPRISGPSSPSWSEAGFRSADATLVIPGQEALPGSEAASRFLGGMIPEINFFEVEQVWVVGAL